MILFRAHISSFEEDFFCVFIARPSMPPKKFMSDDSTSVIEHGGMSDEM